VHFLSISTEHDFSIGSAQYNFISNDLHRAWLRKLAGDIQFIIAFGHKPMYSSSSNHGSDFTLRASLELIFINYTVDIAVWGHDHTYERTFPIFESSVKNPSLHDYNNLRGAIIHSVVGNSGQHLYAFSNQPNWSAYREAEFGLSNFLASSSGALYWNYTRSSTNTRQDYYILRHSASPPDTPTPAPTPQPTPVSTPTPVQLNHSSSISTVILLLILFALLGVVLGTFLYLKYRENIIKFISKYVPARESMQSHILEEENL